MEEKQSFLEKFWYLFIIIAAICLGGVGFLWMNNQNVLKLKAGIQKPQEETEQMEMQEEAPIEEQEEFDEATEKLEQQQESDEIENIEYDLQTTDFTDIDKELGEIDSELEGE